MRKILFTLIVIASCSPLWAQHYTEDYVIDARMKGSRTSDLGMVYGLMVGANIPLLTDKIDVADVSQAAGFQIGARWGVDLGGLEIVPEIWYMHDKMHVESKSTNSTGDLVTNSLEFPIVFGIGLGQYVRFDVGPSFSLMSNNKYYDDDGSDVEDFGSFKSTFGYLIGFSTTIAEHYVVDLRYSGRFVSTELAHPHGGEESDYRYYNICINFGYRF